MSLVYALVGNPNCGKTTLFNALTGLKQRVGNYAGVTVEKKEGEFFSQHGDRLRLIDLPGSYSLHAQSPDEAIMRDVLLGRLPEMPKPDRIVCVVDANNLERNLYLVSQVLELGLPVIVALNMVDVAEARGLRLDPARLSEKLGCPVVVTVASQRKGLVELKLAMSRTELPLPRPFLEAIPVQLRAALVRTRESMVQFGVISQQATPLEPLYLLTDHDPARTGFSKAHQDIIASTRQQIDREFPRWEDNLVASRYDAIHHACSDVLRRPETPGRTWTDLLDSIFLHKRWGWAFLLGILTLLFWMIFAVAEGPKEWIESFMTWISHQFGYVNEAGEEVAGWLPPGDLRDLIVDGALAGVGGVLVFLPQILILFFFIGLMEETGYMSRIAFIMDRFMGRVGLTGRSFLPLLSSYACAVPGVMAARTIDNAKDRLITMLVVPLASCSARLPVYSLIIAILLPGEYGTWQKSLIMVSMYAISTLGAFFFAWLFRRKLMPGAQGSLILELPPYKPPTWKSILLHMWQRAWMFVRRAGTVILGLSILLWAALHYPKQENATPAEQIAHSFAGKMGHAIEPLIKPMGCDWKIGIGLISSFAAREMFTSGMGVVYAMESPDDETALAARMKEEKWPDGSPIYSPRLCWALMVFFVFAMQCLSTVAVVKRETGGWKWPLFQLAYMTVAAYGLAVLIYQVGGLF
jgi:ferrous iron transport protein B